MEKDIISSEDNGAQVRHPVLGPIVILVASKPIAKEEEVTAQNNVIIPSILFCCIQSEESISGQNEVLFASSLSYL